MQEVERQDENSNLTFSANSFSYQSVSGQNHEECRTGFEVIRIGFGSPSLTACDVGQSQFTSLKPPFHS